MQDIRNIMVAGDFSPISQHLVGYAWALGQKINAAIDLVNVINQRDVGALNKVADVTTALSFPDQLNKMRESRHSSNIRGGESWKQTCIEHIPFYNDHM